MTQNQWLAKTRSRPRAVHEPSKSGFSLPKLTKRLVDDLAPAAQSRLIWDAELKGFGLRIQPSGVRSFILQYRTAIGRSRRMVLGRYGVLTVDEARTKARTILVAVTNGADPVADKASLRASPTIAEFLERHIEEHVRVHNSQKTLQEVEYLFRRIAVPKLGALKVADVGRRDLAKLHIELQATPTQANRVLAVLSKAFANAELWGLRPASSNPCKGLRRYPEAHRERYLSGSELKRLGEALEEAARDGIPWQADPEVPESKHLPKPENRRTRIAREILDAIKLLLLTGARRGEIISLEWAHVNLEARTLDLPAKKGGRRRRHPVSAAALQLLEGVAQVEGSAWVFPRSLDPARHISGEVVENAWQRLRARAGISDVRLHDLRHTVGTVASATGANSFVVRDLLRHASTAMTTRYVNFDDDPVRAVSDLVGERISAGLTGAADREVKAAVGKKSAPRKASGKLRIKP